MQYFRRISKTGMDAWSRHVRLSEKQRRAMSSRYQTPNVPDQDCTKLTGCNQSPHILHTYTSMCFAVLNHPQQGDESANQQPLQQ